MFKLAVLVSAFAVTAASAQHARTAPAASVKAEIVSPATFNAGQTASTVVRLTGPDGKPLTADELQVAHTEKLHLLVVDETLSDYHHEHPAPAEKPGEYRFDFSPRVGGTYHVWADVVPISTGQQQYADARVRVQGSPAKKTKALNNTAEADGYRFSLTTENNAALRAGEGTMVSIKVTTADGKEFTGLEPVMGAFAHMVGFPETVDAVTHVHPTGKEPETESERGGPELRFHVAPEKAGYHKFYVQTQIGGREVYAGFGVDVKPGTKRKPTAAAEYTCPMHPEVTQKTPGKCPKCGMDLVPNEGHKHEHAH